MPHRYWLFKTEPTEFSIDDLQRSPDRTTSWCGVRNYQARNLLRDEVQVGDDILFYHSTTEIPGIAGTARVVRSGHPDLTAQDPANPYFDPKATPAKPIWVAVDVQFLLKLCEVIPLSRLRETKGLENMMVCQRGARLSIQPVTATEWRVVKRLMDQRIDDDQPAR